MTAARRTWCLDWEILFDALVVAGNTNDGKLLFGILVLLPM